MGWYRSASRRLRVRTSGLPVAFSGLMMTVPESGVRSARAWTPVSWTRSELHNDEMPVAAPFQVHVSGVGHGETWNIRFNFLSTTLTGRSTG